MPYSLDLRTNIVSAYEAEKTSIRKVAKQFMVTPKTVISLIKLKRETGNLEPKKSGNPTPSELEAHKELIVATVEAHPDWNLWQCYEEIGEKMGVYVTHLTQSEDPPHPLLPRGEKGSKDKIQGFLVLLSLNGRGARVLANSA